MSRDIAPFGLRMPAELKETLEKLAKDNKRSLNAEIVSRLEFTVSAFEQSNPETQHKEMWDEVRAQMDASFERIEAADKRLDDITDETMARLAELSKRVEDDRSVVDRLLDRTGLRRK